MSVWTPMTSLMDCKDNTVLSGRKDFKQEVHQRKASFTGILRTQIELKV